MALTAEQRIERAHIDLMKSPQFVAYSGILMIGEARIMDDIPTAMTNGKDVYFGRKFVDGLNDSDLRGVIIHEAKHKMYRHLLTWKHLSDINSVKANMACDFVINAEIIDESEQSSRFITLPKGGLYDPKFKGMDSSQVFYLLPDYIEGAGFLCADGSGNGGIVGLTKGFDHHDWEGAEDLNEAEKADLEKEIDQAIRQGAILAGKVGGNINRSFNDLMSAKVNWKDALREFVSSICQGKDDSTWRKPNRRWLQHDIYMPSTISETTGRIVVAVDTSGSIQGAILDRFLSEVSAIMENVNPEQVDLLYWDSEVAGHEVYGLNDADKMRHSTKPKGGGGTSPSCITKYMRKHKIDPVCAIILTDGYVGSDWGGTWNCPVLWTIVGNQYANPTIGSAIYMENN